MAKTIATIGGVALKPGVSKNRRLYTTQHIAKLVTAAQERIRAGDEPMVMLSHHDAGDDSTRIAAHLTGVSLGEDGSARYTAAIADTAAGRDIASLVDRSGGEPHLKGVSIRGHWLGRVRTVKAPDGRDAETADGGMELDGLDFTRSPGVPGAQVDTFAWADGGGKTETTERVPIFESVQEARVTTITEEQAPAAALTEAERAMLPAAPHILENGICVTCAGVAEAGAPMSKRTSGTQGTGGPFADPGYQDDKKQRYQLDTKAHVRAALGFLSQKSNAAKYTPNQLKLVMGRIKAAARKFGIAVSAESAGWSFDAPAQVSETLAEYYGDSGCAGSWSVNASNGPVSICLSSYSADPEDLDVILRAAADAACKALAALDPDMDGDIDVPGAPGADTDHDGGESAPVPDDPETGPAADPAAAMTESEDSEMTETSTPAAETAPAIDPKVLAEAVAAATAQQDEARRARKAAKRAAQETAAAEAAKAATEAAAAQAAASAALGQGTPATAGAAVSETAAQRMARLSALAETKIAERMKAEGLAAEETDEQILDRLLEEKLVPLRQARAERGGVVRKGLIEAIADQASDGKKALQESSNDDLAHMAAAMFPGAGARR